MKDLKKEYFDWMYSSANTDPYGNFHSEYQGLLHYLNNVAFNYYIPMDANRESDGISLRYHFGYEKGIQSSEITDILDDRPCSLLEMMVALCRRMETMIGNDPDYGNRTYIWFHTMLESMGLEDLTDRYFDEDEAEYRVGICLSGRYEPNGKGGFFTLSNPSTDLRGVEIWNQAMWFLNEYTGLYDA